MGLAEAVPQMSGQLELPFGKRGESPGDEWSEEASAAAHGDGRSGASGLLEKALERGNLQAALKRVRSNKGSPGIDGMTVEELPDHLREHWPRIREELLAGGYRPTAVKRQEIA